MTPELSVREAAVELVDDALTRAWVGLLQRPWKTLAVVPAPDVDAGGFIASLERLSRRRSFADVQVLDTRRRTIDAMPELLAAVKNARSRQVLILDSPARSAVAVALSRQADAAVLVIALGRTDVAAARAELSALGRDKFLGCAVVERSSR